MKKFFYVLTSSISLIASIHAAHQDSYQNTPSTHALYQAACIVPVTNIFKISLSKTFPEVSPEEIIFTYQYQPHSAHDIKDLYRIRQLLFNEQVQVLEELDQELYISCYAPGTLKNSTTIEPLTGWVLKQDFVSITGTINNAIPVQLYYTPHQKTPEELKQITQHIITLITPVRITCYDRSFTFSAGTRFVLHDSDDTDYIIMFYDKKTNCVIHTPLAKDLAIFDTPRTLNNKQRIFLEAARNMCQAHATCPTVWGGSSYVHPVTTPTDFTDQLRIALDEKFYEMYERPEKPATGCDMSGMLFLLNKIAGLRFFAQNSRDIYQLLPAKNFSDHIEESESLLLTPGDLIVAKGYIGILSGDNAVIETRSYEHHDGISRNTPLNTTFENITSYQELVEAYTEQKPLILLGRDNKKIGELTPWKLVDFKTLDTPMTEYMQEK